MSDDWYEEVKDCMWTHAMWEAELLRIEKLLGERFGVTENIREHLITLDKADLLVEDELVADWHCAYASFLHWPHDDEEENPDRSAETSDSQD